MIHRAVPALFVAALLYAVPATADVTLIHAGELLAVPGEAPAREMTIIVEDGVIAGVQRGYVETDDATIVEGGHLERRSLGINKLLQG